MTPNPAAERRNNVSHGREPVEKVIHGEFQPHRGGTIAASCVVPPGLGPWQYSVHGLTPGANVISPLRGWFRLNRNSSTGCFSGTRSGVPNFSREQRPSEEVRRSRSVESPTTLLSLRIACLSLRQVRLEE